MPNTAFFLLRVLLFTNGKYSQECSKIAFETATIQFLVGFLPTNYATLPHLCSKLNLPASLSNHFTMLLHLFACQHALTLSLSECLLYSPTQIKAHVYVYVINNSGKSSGARFSEAFPLASAKSSRLSTSWLASPAGFGFMQVRPATRGLHLREKSREGSLPKHGQVTSHLKKFHLLKAYRTFPLAVTTDFQSSKN